MGSVNKLISVLVFGCAALLAVTSAHNQQLLCCKLQSAAYVRAAPPLLPAISVHDRPWKYPTGGTPGLIEVWHMWHLLVPIA